jgi:hypothetical protein
VIAALLGLMIVLVLLYMARPRYEKRRVSSAAFFGELPESRQSRFRLRFANPLLRRPLYLQMLVLGLTLLALWLANMQWTRQQEVSQVLLILDTSASMDTTAAGESRFQQAQKRLGDIVAVVERAATGETQPRYSLATFDMEIRSLNEGIAASTVASFASTIEPRPLGTDLAILRGFIERQVATYSHVFVVTDTPPPGWSETVEGGLVWQNIGDAADNIGFESIVAVRDPLSGAVERIQFVIRAHGNPQPCSVQILDENDEILFERELTWRDGLFRGQFVPPVTVETQLLRFQLSEGGAYHWDDRADIIVQTQPDLAIDWQVETPQLQRLFRSSDATDPRVQITSQWSPNHSLPQLVIGPGFQTSESRVRDFTEHPILTDLNLDVAERLVPLNHELPEGMIPVLRTQTGRVWAAVTTNPPSVFIAGLPQLDDSDEGKFTTTLFFNSLRWLLEQTPPAPLYALTSPNQQNPESGITVLHPGEGDTQQVMTPASVPQIDSLTKTSTSQVPIWPPFFFAVVLVMGVERWLAVWGGRSWR